MKYIFCSIIGYLVRTINPAHLFAKIKGFDIREKGSKNAGASNVLILFGKVWGIICALMDITKAFSCAIACRGFVPESYTCMSILRFRPCISVLYEFQGRKRLGVLLSQTAPDSTDIWFAWPISRTLATAESLIFYKRKIANKE